jgi:multidrug resistance efflux pump
MATFNQQNQIVHGGQYNADTINITHGHHSPIDARTIAAEFDRALSGVRELSIPLSTREQVTSELTAARAELESGQADAARGRMAGLLANGEQVASIVSSLASAVGVFLNG